MPAEAKPRNQASSCSRYPFVSSSFRAELLDVTFSKGCTSARGADLQGIASAAGHAAATRRRHARPVVVAGPCAGMYVSSLCLAARLTCR